MCSIWQPRMFSKMSISAAANSNRTAVPPPTAPPPPSPVHVTPNSPLLFDALYERNFSLAFALAEENRGLLFVSGVESKNTVLHAAVLHDAPTEIVVLLVQKGCDVNARNQMGRTPVYIAARHNVRISTMKFLIKAGGNVNLTDNFSYTPLMASAYNGASLTLVGALLGLGAVIDLRDGHNRNAANWAEEGHHDQISVFLNNIMVLPVICSVYVTRLGRKSALRVLPVDLIRMVRDMLALSGSRSRRAGS